MNMTLYYQAGNSDKVYKISVDAAGNDLYKVNFAYGRRGSTLQTGTKTQKPVTLEQAEKIFRKLALQKMGKGYRQGIEETSYAVPVIDKEESGVHCQLLNPVDEDDLDKYLTDNAWGAQEKHDGRRMLIRKAGDTVTGINRLGFIIGIPQLFAYTAKEIPGDFIIDGEAVGNHYYAFDLLELNGENLRHHTYRQRLLALTELLLDVNRHAFHRVDTALGTEGKRELLEVLQAENREGIVLKDMSAPFTPDRPSSGGTQLKFKFYKTATCIVTGQNAKRSVSLGLIHNGQITPCGNVTIPANHNIPATDTTVEIRFLYAMPGSNALYQPVYLGVRDDITRPECTLDQLKYKAA